MPRRRGTALVLVVIFGLLTAGIALSLHLALASLVKGNAESELEARRLLATDAGLAKGTVLLARDYTEILASQQASCTLLTETLPDGSGVVSLDVLQGASSPYLFRLRSTTTLWGQTRELELYVRVSDPPGEGETLGAPFLGAVVAAGNIMVNGTIVIDGRDHFPDGVLNPGGQAVPGTHTTGATNRGGAAQIGGGGWPLAGAVQAPSKTPTFSRVQNTAAFAPEADRGNGLDDDGDTLVDENGFPRSAGAFLRVTNAALKARAQATGTYFSGATATAAYLAYEAWRNAASSAEQGGKVIYIEVPDGAGVVNNPFLLPSKSPPARPSLVIIAHREVVDDEAGGDGDAATVRHDIEIKNVHGGPFQGVLFADLVNKVNAGTRIVGAVVSFNGLRLDGTTPASTVTHFGNGTADILFSSQVLANLPGVVGPSAGRGQLGLLLWRRVR